MQLDMCLFWYILFTYWITAVLSRSCLELKLQLEKDCQRSEDENYIECVKTRMKRHSNTCEYEDNCFNCDCDLCQYSECDGQCDNCCNSCCPNYVQCHTTHCCHKQCHVECRTYSCRSACRKSCYESVPRESEKQNNQRTIERIIENVVVGGSSADNRQTNTTNINAHNITTVINLKNVINNTNLVDVPINLNYTNRNNISLNDWLTSSGASGYGGNISDNCCIVIGPRQCQQITTRPFVKCFHTRSRQCGSFCSASIVHQEQTQICNTVNAYGQRVCQPQTAYIPQPQPKCVYTSTWPYVSCGIQPRLGCEGCYGHYFTPESKEYKSCPQHCFDDFSVGPLYRQGPFYQPRYLPYPPYYPSCRGNCGSKLYGGMGGLLPNVENLAGIGMPAPYEGIPGSYGGGFGVYGMGGVSGYGGGFGYANQVPMLQPGTPIFQPQPRVFFPTLINVPSINTTTNNSAFPNLTELVDPMIINEYQADRPYVPLYELPGKEVEIEVKIIDPEKN